MQRLHLFGSLSFFLALFDSLWLSLTLFGSLCLSLAPFASHCVASPGLAADKSARRTITLASLGKRGALVRRGPKYIGAGTNALRLGPATAPKPPPKGRACLVGLCRVASRDGPSRLPCRAVPPVRPRKASEVLFRAAFQNAAMGCAVRPAASGFFAPLQGLLAAVGCTDRPATPGIEEVFSPLEGFLAAVGCAVRPAAPGFSLLSTACAPRWAAPLGQPRRALTLRSTSTLCRAPAAHVVCLAAPHA